jgi:transcription initiation factor TFIIH subunit 3
VLVQLIHFVNSLLLLNHLNHVVVIAAGVSSCAYVFDSSNAGASGTADVAATLDKASRKVEEFIKQDARETASNGTVAAGGAASLFSGALSIALCCILWSNSCLLCNDWPLFLGAYVSLI